MRLAQKPSTSNTSSRPPTAPSSVDAGGSPTMAPSSSMPSDMIWPPVGGRLMLHDALAGGLTPMRVADSDWGCTVGRRWVVYSYGNNVFPDVKSDRASLLTWARTHSANLAMISSERCIALQQDGRGDIGCGKLCANEKRYATFWANRCLGAPTGGLGDVDYRKIVYRSGSVMDDR